MTPPLSRRFRFGRARGPVPAPTVHRSLPTGDGRYDDPRVESVVAGAARCSLLTRAGIIGESDATVRRLQAVATCRMARMRRVHGGTADRGRGPAGRGRARVEERAPDWTTTSAA